MFCPNCGTQVSDSAAFCPSCGARLAAPAPAPTTEPVQPAPTPAPMQPVPQQAAYQPQPASQQAVYQQVPDQQTAPQTINPTTQPSNGNFSFSFNKAGVQYAESTGLKMKWFKALTVVLLYCVAFINFWNAISYLQNAALGLVPSYDGAYSIATPFLRGLSLFYGLYCIALGVACLSARKRLARFAADAPHFYLTLLFVNMCVSLGISFALDASAGNLDLIVFVSKIATNLALFFLNKIYFDKRKHLFTM